MLPQFWLLTILASLALGVPVPGKLGLDKSNTLIYSHRVEKVTTGSRTTLNEKGTSSIVGYPAHGTGVSSSHRSVLDKKQESSTSGQGSGTHPASPLTTGSFGGTSSDSGASKEHKQGGLHRGHDEHGGHGGGMEGGKSHEQVKSDGSSSTTNGSDGTSTGTTTGSDSTSSGTTTGSEGTTGSDGTTTSISKHK